MNLKWEPDNSALVEIMVSEYDYATLDDVKETIDEIRGSAESMTINFDLKSVDVPGSEKFKEIIKLVMDVLEYTKDDNLLERINIKNAGFLFRFFYRPFSLAIPREIRKAIVFI
jgi:hypothetical protein